MVTRENQRYYTNGWGTLGSILGRPGADQASSFSGALHGFEESCKRLLMSVNIRLVSAFARGVQRNVDESRGAAVDS